MENWQQHQWKAMHSLLQEPVPAHVTESIMFGSSMVPVEEYEEVAPQIAPWVKILAMYIHVIEKSPNDIRAFLHEIASYRPKLSLANEVVHVMIEQVLAQAAPSKHQTQHWNALKEVLTRATSAPTDEWSIV